MEMTPKLYKLSEKKYLKDPSKWNVHFVGWSAKGRPYAMATKVTGVLFFNGSLQGKQPVV